MKKLFVLLIPFVATSQFNNLEFQSEFTKVFNEYRNSNNLPSLSINTNANSSAKIQSDYLISTYHRDTITKKIIGNLGHTNPDVYLYSPALRLKSIDTTLDIDSASIGENILVLASYDEYDLIDNKQLAKDVLQIWKTSVGHDLNLKSVRDSFGIYISHTTIDIPYTDYEIDVATLTPKLVTKYYTHHYYIATLVLVGNVTWY